MKALGGYWKSVSSVFIGSVIAQAIPILGAIVVARIYSPDEFGIYAAWLGVLMIISTGLSLRLEASLALERDGRPRKYAVFSVFITTVLVTTIVGFLIFFIVFFLEYNFFSSTTLALMLIPAALFFALNQIWQSWAAADGSFYSLNVMRILQASSILIFQLSAGFFYQNAYALILAHLLSLVFVQFVYFLMLPLQVYRIGLVKKILVGYWRKHRRFPIYSMPADFSNALSSQLPIILVADRFGAESAGYLAMSIRVLGAPLSFVGKAVLDVFRRYAAISFREKGNCVDIYRSTFFILMCMSLIFSVVLLFFAEELFVYVFGSEWLVSASISIVLIPLFAMRFVASPLSYVMYIANKQSYDLIWQLVLLLMTFSVFWFGENAFSAISYYSYGYAALYFVYLIMSYRFSKGV